MKNEKTNCISESISSDQCKIFANCYLEKRNQNTYDDLFNTSTALPATGSSKLALYVGTVKDTRNLTMYGTQRGFKCKEELANNVKYVFAMCISVFP